MHVFIWFLFLFIATFTIPMHNFQNNSLTILKLNLINSLNNWNVNLNFEKRMKIKIEN